MADADDEIGETNESDNIFTRTIVVSQAVTPLTSGVAVTGLTGGSNSVRLYKITVPADSDDARMISSN